jgi:hypothetical protein
MRGSLFESSVMAKWNEQLIPYEEKDQKLAFVQHCDEATRFTFDLV